MVIILVVDLERLRSIERDSLNFQDLQGGILHRDLDQDFCEVPPKAYYKYPIEISKVLSGPNGLNLLSWNCQGLDSSLDYSKDLCLFSKLDVIALIETWLRDHTTSLLDIGEYRLHVQNIERRQHGELADYVRNGLDIKVRNEKRVNKEMVFESVVLELCKSGQKFFVVVVYRPPSGSTEEFLELLEKQLDELADDNKPLFVCGDFNLDLTRVSANPKIREFLNVMSCYGVFPVVNICTRVTANSESLLDNIFCDIKYDSVSVVINDVSDHFGVLLCVNNFCTPMSKN